jgi:hypothetical protein
MGARAVIIAATGALGVAAAHGAHRSADRVRHDRSDETRTLYQPRGEALRVAAMGQHVLVADAMWVRAVLQFADLLEHPTDTNTRWVEATLHAIAALDPQWRTVYFYGGSFMRLMGDTDGSDQLFEMGRSQLPDDPYFPFALGMNAYLLRDDRAAAQVWLSRAAAMKGAPPWYHAAAAAFLEGKGERRAAIRYVEEQMADEARPAVLRSLSRKRQALMHDELSEQMTDELRAWEAQRNVRAPDLSVLGKLPEDPLGGEWIRAPDGVPRSSVRERLLDRRSRIDERQMLLLAEPERGFPESSGL